MSILDFAITTDYLTSTGSALPYLESAAAAGWKWIHWCHHWNDDHCYDEPELAQIESALDRLGLRILDIHGSTGRRHRWDSPRESFRQQGVQLVRNRLTMATRLACDVVIMHPSNKPGLFTRADQLWTSLCRSIDQLIPDLRRLNIRLAMENLAHENFDQVDKLLALYPPDVLGLCYDPGHGQLARTGLDRLTPHLDRLIAVHLNDNDSRRDLHQPPFMGRVDWPRLAALIARSSYARPAMSVEVVMKHAGIADQQQFLTQTLAAARRLGEMVVSAKPD